MTVKSKKTPLPAKYQDKLKDIFDELKKEEKNSFPAGKPIKIEQDPDGTVTYII